MLHSQKIALGAIAVLTGGPVFSSATNSRHNLARDNGTSTTEDCRASTFDTHELVWEQITPSTNLSWVSCYDTLQCAKLQVPLDWNSTNSTNSTTGRTAAIAMIRLPSKITAGQPGYKGPLIVNPGGPGESGVDLMTGSASMLAALVGPGYDIVSFDPRGIGRTTPQVLLFDDENEHIQWFMRAYEDPTIGATPDAVARNFARAQVYAGLAQQRLADVAPYVNSPSVARDMLAMVRAFGYEKISYYAISYGTLLGATFAAMFPNNIERMVIDGVVDANDYYAGGGLTYLTDTDKTLQMFYAACANATASECALHESTASNVQQRAEKIYAQVLATPIAAFIPQNATTFGAASTYGVLNYRMLRTIISRFLYSPYNPGAAPALASALAAIEKGNGAPMWELWTQASFADVAFQQCPCANATVAPVLSTDSQGIEAAVQCGDADYSAYNSVSAMTSYYKKMAKQSTFSDIWLLQMQCGPWSIKPSTKFNASFTQNTSYPLLLIGNTADPITPRANAFTMSKGFKGSVVLTQNCGGHSSLAASSRCTEQAIQLYFQNGTLPANGTVCQIEDVMFSNKTTTSKRDSLSRRTLKKILTKRSGY